MTDPHLDSLLKQARWVRELARSLVRDPHLADDLAQDAMVIALERADSPPRSMRGWLASIVRHRLWEKRRSEDRRAAREERSAREEGQESTAEVVARAAAHRAVVEALMELPEAYRDVLLLRYFEGETPIAIARKTGVPVATVKTRLQRGLAALRERLDRRSGGDGKSWLSALAPLLRAPAATGAALKVGVAVALIVAVLGTVGAWVGPRLSHREGTPIRLARQPSALPAPVRDAPPEPSRLFTDREAVVPREAADPAEGAAPRLPSVVRGTVRDPSGNPVVGVVVRFFADAPDTRTGTGVAVSDAAGEFELRGVRGRGRVQAVSTDLVNLYSGEAGGYDEWTPNVVVAPRTVVVGRVLDPGGVPLEGVHLEVVCSADEVSAQARSWRERFATLSSAAGDFLLEAPDVPRAELVLSLDGYRTLRKPLSAGGFEVVTLEPLAAAWVDGRVSAPDGTPVAGARVSNGREERRSGPGGRFRIPAPEPGTPIFAAADGFGPALAEALADGSWSDLLELRLANGAYEITGRVVDRGGHGLRGVRVAIQHPTTFLARRASAGTDGLIETWREDPDPETDRARPILFESLNAGQPTALSTEVETGPDGTFVLGGLLDRTYALIAIDPMSLAMGRVGPTPAGAEDVRIELTHAVVPRIEGRVLDRLGNGVREVTLLPFRTLQTVWHGGQVLRRTDVGNRAVLGDEDGSFFLSEVATEGAYLRIEGPDVWPTEIPLTPGDDGRFEVRVDRSATVQFADGPWEAAQVAVTDAAGVELVSYVSRGGRRIRRLRWPIVDGGSPPLVVPTAARELVVYVADVVVLKSPLSLRAGERETVRP